jgi:hypothetical protein
VVAAVPPGVDADALLERGGQHVRLEARSRLDLRVEGVVELLVDVVLAAVEGVDLAVRRIDGHQTGHDLLGDT